MLTEGQLVGSYRIVRQLGVGGMGAVYEALHPGINRRAAIKVLHPQFGENAEFAARFLNEARAANIVDHPGIVEIFEHGRLEDGTTYIVMELLKGESLRHRMKAAGKLPLSEALLLTRQIASALAAAHDKGIIHRDLKPDNVFIIPDPEAPSGHRIKLLDFGIAKLAEEHLQQEDAAVKTNSAAMLGTPLYISPEQCKKAGGVTAKADVYSLGVMLYQMLAGRPPFVAEDAGMGMLFAMHIYHEPPPLTEAEPTVPAVTAALVHSMLKKDPAQRPELRAIIDLLVQQGAGAATDPTAKKESIPDSAPRPRRWALLAGALIAVIGFLLGGLQLWRRAPLPQAEQKTMPPGPGLAHWRLQTDPPGAQMVRIPDEAVLCAETPCELDIPLGTGQSGITIELRRSGYVSQRVDLDRQGGTRLLKLLAPIF